MRGPTSDGRLVNATAVIVGIGGAALPFVVGRLRRNYSLDQKLGDPDASLAAMYYDTIVHDPKVLRFLADTVGAGDAFMSGLLHAIASGPLHSALLDDAPMHEADLETAVQIATASAALTVQRTGANPPSLEELTGLMATHR